MATENSKAKYAKFLKSPIWNEPVFSEENYLVTITNTDPKDERSYYHKKKEILLDFDWVTSPEAGILLVGTRSGSDLVNISYVTRIDDKWTQEEDKTKEAEARFKEHSLIAIHTTPELCLPLYCFSEKLAQHKVVVDVGTGIDLNLSDNSEFDRDKFYSCFDILIDYLIKDPNKIFSDLSIDNPEVFTLLTTYGFENNLISKIAMRKGRWIIPGLDMSELPVWSNAPAYTRPESINTTKSNTRSGSNSRSSVTPQQKIATLTSLLTDTAACKALQDASTAFGYTLTPEQTLSVLVAASIGCYVPFHNHVDPVSSKMELPKKSDSVETITTQTNSNGSSSLSDNERTELLESITSHANWNPQSGWIKRLLTIEYQTDPDSVKDLDTDSLKNLISDLDNKK